jgi:hypothetical protein
MKTVIGLLLVLLLVSCTKAPVIQTVEVTRVITQEFEVTRIVKQTAVVTWVYKVIITATPKPATVVPPPTRTSGPTKTPVPTNTASPTVDPQIQTATAQAAIDLFLKKDHAPGVYLVGVDIAPGVWRNSSTRDDCYWKRADKYGEIIDNYFGFGGGTIYISPMDFQVELNQECGIWTWLSPP